MSKSLGVYEMGYNRVEIEYDAKENGGSFTLLPKGDRRVSVISVGLKHNRWQNVLDVLLHEAMELALYRANARFDPSQNVTGDHSKYLFCCNHPTFSDCCAVVAELITGCQRDLFKVWKASQKKGKK